MRISMFAIFQSALIAVLFAVVGVVAIVVADRLDAAILFFTCAAVVGVIALHRMRVHRADARRRAEELP